MLVGLLLMDLAVMEKLPFKITLKRMLAMMIKVVIMMIVMGNVLDTLDSFLS